MNKPSTYKFKNNGMTLIEVLVSMLILSLSLVAALRTAGYATTNQILLRDRAYAEWVGRNRLASRRIDGAFWQNSGEVKGEGSMASKDFIWQETITYVPGSNPYFRLIELTVADKKRPKAVLFRAVDFTRKPL